MTVLIITTVAMVVFAILIILTRRPLLKQKSPLRLSPAKKVTFGQGVFVLRGDGVEFAFVRNLGVRVAVGGESVLIKFPPYSHFSISPKRMILSYPNQRVEIDKMGVRFDCSEEREFCLEFAKPRFPFCVESSRKAVVLGNRCLRMSLCDFDNFEIAKTGDGKLRIGGKFGKSARISFDQPLSPLDITKLREYKQRNFGIIDTSCWEILPSFDSPKFNSLQADSIKTKLDLSARKVSIPTDFDTHILEAKTTAVLQGKGLISLDNLGLGKILRFKKVGKNVVILDLLTNISFRIECDSGFRYELKNIWGHNFLLMQSEPPVCRLHILPFYQYVNLCDLSNEIQLSSIYDTQNSVSVDAVFRRLTLNILHGFWADVGKLAQSINYRFLARKTQFLLANLILTFVEAFANTQLLGHKKVRRLLVFGLDYAVGKSDAESMIFCQKILPFVRNERAYQRVNLSIPSTPIFAEKLDNEYVFREVLGVKLIGNHLTISPAKNQSICTDILLRGKRLRLKILPNWRAVNVNDLRLNNICTFDLDKLSDNTLLTFD